MVPAGGLRELEEGWEVRFCGGGEVVVEMEVEMFVVLEGYL